MNKTKMTPKNLVTSLPLSKQLHKAGWVRETLFYWNKQGTLEYADPKTWVRYTTDYPAPTASELMEVLPELYSVYRAYDYYSRKDVYQCTPPEEDKKKVKFTTAPTPHDALAKMCIYLAEKGIIDLGEVKK